MKEKFRLRHLPLALGCAVLCILLLAWGEPAAAGVKRGLRTCAEVIIPSLYLFMAVSGFIALSPAGELLSRPLSLFTRRLLRLPECMGSVVVLSFLGGYPVGAKTIDCMLESGRINKEQAERAICFCCNAGPSFVVTAIGARMLHSPAFGAALLGAHILSALLIGILLSRRAPVPQKGGSGGAVLPAGQAFVLAVNNATSGILIICAFVVLFSACGELLDYSGVLEHISALLPGAALGGDALRAIIVGLLEVTTGCLQAAALPGILPAVLIPLMVSFAGLSIHFQVRSSLSNRGLSFCRFTLCRCLHALLTLGVFWPLYRSLHLAQQTFYPIYYPYPPVGYYNPNTPIATILLLLVSGVVLLLVCAPLYLLGSRLDPDRSKKESAKAGKR